jgi:hypothetical protein
MNSENGHRVKIVEETPTQVTNLNHWGEGHSPKEVLTNIMESIDDITDVVIVARYRRSDGTEDQYAVGSSSGALHSKLGLLKLGGYLISKYHSLDL